MSYSRKPVIVNTRTKQCNATKFSGVDLIGVVFALVGCLTIIYAIIVLVSGAFTSNFSAYHAWLESISWTTGIGVIMLVASAIFIAPRCRSRAPVLFLISILVGFLIVIWIDYLRPGDDIMLHDLGAFINFKNLISFLEFATIIIFVVGIASNFLHF